MELTVDKNPFLLSYYTKLTQDYDSGNIRPPEVILPYVPGVSQDPSTLPLPQEYLLPSVILWDPLQQLECFRDGVRCPNDSHTDEGATLEPKRSKSGEFWWQAGHRAAVAPRQLCSSNWPVILLSRIYVCTGHLKHRSYIAHDPEILAMVPASEIDKVPFVLLHRTGFTKELQDTVISLVSTGERLEQIEQTITQQHVTNFTHCKEKYEEDISNYCGEESPTLFPEYKPVGVPSMEMLLGSLQVNYSEKEPYYTQRMSELSASVLLLGHFFKAGQQMGCFTQLDKGTRKWNPKYDYLFAVMNEKGQVLAWQSTKGTQTKDILPLLRGVHGRLTEQGVSIQLILTPNCCEFREHLEEIFGSDVQVKMDPSFAVRKLETRFKVRKCDHEIVKNCLHNFELVFRQGADIELCPTQETPSIEAMRANFESFVSHWKVVKGGLDSRLMHEPVIRKLSELHTDVCNGCLSGVPPTCGSEYVSLLRDHLRPVLHRRFLNADLTLPAVTSLLYIWNELHSGNSTLAMPVSSYKDALDLVGFVPTDECFGRIPQESAAVEPIDNNSFQYTLDIHSVQCLITCTLGVHDQDLYPESDASCLSDTALLKLYHLASNYLIVQNHLNYLQASAKMGIDPRLWHLLPTSVLLFSRSDCAVNNVPAHENRLKVLVSQLQGVLLGDNEDGDGFFISLAGSLVRMLEMVRQKSSTELAALREHLQVVGFDPDNLDDERMNVITLRKIISGEWERNKEKYARLLMSPLLDLVEEAQRFTREGYCKADVLNLLPITASHVFRLPIILFTSLELFPIIPIIPCERPIIKSCLFMGYNAGGYGTYYTVMLSPCQPPLSPSPATPSKKPKFSCRCGLGNSKDKENRNFCVSIKGRYRTRCECFRNGVGCGYLCRCYNCGNPEGTSDESRAQITEPKTRTRPRHKFQRPKEVEDSNAVHGWSDREQLVVECLIDAMHNPREGIWVLEATAEEIMHQYNTTIQLVPSVENSDSACDESLGAKTIDDVKRMIKVVDKHVQEFDALYKKQTELNWDQLESFPVTGDLNAPECSQVFVIVQGSDS